MAPKELLTIGVVAVAAIGVLVFVASRQSTSTSTGVDPNAASTQNAIISANTAAMNTQASQALGLAQLAVQSQGIADSQNVALAKTAAGVTTSSAQTAASETLGLAQLATGFATVHDNNQTAITTAANNGATTLQLATMAANATYQSALLDTVAKIESTIAGAQTSQYTSYVTGQTALAGDAATTSQVGLATAASQAIAQINGQTQVDVAGIAGQTAQTVATVQSTAAQNIANTQASAAVAQSNAAASASKSNGFWGALASIAGSVVKVFDPLASSPQVATSNPVTVLGPNGPITNVATATYN